MIQLPISLQIYSLRSIFEDNPLKAMKAAKSAGYDGVEFYGSHFQPELYAALLKETGLVCTGWHTSIDALEKDFEKTLSRNLAVGNKYICVPYYKADTAAGWADFAERLNKIAEKLARYGIRTGYHAHAHDFAAVEGQIPWDIVAQKTLPQVILQIDTGNAMAGHADPLEFMEKYPGRAITVHLKPYCAKTGYDCIIGEDDSPWEKFLAFCEQRGNTEWLIVEYEVQNDPVSAVERCAAYLRKLRPL